MTEENNIITTNEPSESDDHALLITLRFVVVGIGIVLNGLVSGVFMYIRMYKKSITHGLIVQQSFVDLFGCCLFLFFYNQDAPDGHSGRFFCKARALYWFTTSTSTYNLVMITTERFIAVVHPITYRNLSIRRSSRIFHILPYIIGFLISFHLAIIADSNKELEGECRYNYPNRAVSLFSGLCLFFTLFLLPACFMIYCYYRMLMKIRKQVKTQQNRQKKNPDYVKTKSYHISVHRNLVYTMFIVVIGFIVTTSPNFTMYLVYNICQCFEYSTVIAHEFTVLWYTCNMCINPVIYGAKMNDFRNGLRQIRRNILLLVGCDVGEESGNESTADGTLSPSENIEKKTEQSNTDSAI